MSLFFIYLSQHLFIYFVSGGFDYFWSVDYWEYMHFRIKRIPPIIDLLLNAHLSHFMTKPTKWHAGHAKTQISVGIRPVWSGSSLSAWRKLGSLATHWAHSEDWSDWVDAQADLSLCWMHSHFVGFVMRRLILGILRSQAKTIAQGW